MGDEDGARGVRGNESTLPAPNATGAPALAPGTLLEDRYRVLRRLGQGSSGGVYEAVDRELDRHVALKVIRGVGADDEAAYRELRDEARAMARVDHPNVVRIHAFGRFEGRPYFAMELVDGPNLEDWLEQSRALPLALDEAVELLDQIAAGVEAIHAAGAMHGDLKPSNVLVHPSGRLVVSDLGLSQLVARGQDVQRLPLAGTPAYMAPEVLRMERLAPQLIPRVDVYSLAVIAYELVTGRPPFASDDVVAIMNMHATIPPPSPSSIRRELGAVGDEVLLAALAKDPRLRTATPGELVEGLRDQARRVTAATRITIAIVDDDPDFLRFAKETLEQGIPGVRVQTFGSGIEAIREIPRNPPMLALIDLRLPDVNGLEVLATLRADLPRTTPLAVVSAAGDAGDRDALRRIGARELLDKPLMPLELVRAARRMLGWGSLPPPPTAR